MSFFNSSILLIISFGALQGILLAILLRIKYKNRSADYLAVICFLFSVLMAYYVVFWNRIGIPAYLWWVQYLTFMIGPLFYGLIRDEPFQRLFKSRFAFHYMAFPAAIAILYLSLPRYLLFLCQPLHLVVYLLLCFLQFKNRRISQHIWLLISLAGYAAMFCIYTLLVARGILSVEADYMISVAMGGFIYSLMFKSYVDPQFVARLKAENPLSPLLVETVMRQVRLLFENRKPYLSGEYRLSDLASDLAVKPYQLSEIINRHYNGFQHLLNEYRIRESKELLSTAPIKIVDIAFMSGFNNKVSFYKSFRKMTGMTPIEWRKKNKEVKIYMN